MFHPVFAAIDPSILISRGVKTSIFVHAAIDEVLYIRINTSVNLPFIPDYLLDGTILDRFYALIRPLRCVELLFCRRLWRVWLGTRGLHLFAEG